MSENWDNAPSNHHYGAEHTQEPPIGDNTAEQERARLWEAVVALGRSSNAFIEGQRRQAEEQGAVISALIERINNLPLGGKPAPTQHTPSSGDAEPALPRGGLKFHEPRVFDGKVRSVNPFLDEIESAVWLQRASLVTDLDKALYFYTYLKDGSPKSWFSGIKKDETHQYLLHDWDALIQDFRDHFGDSDIHNTALHEMDLLIQTGSCASFASRFRELLPDLDLTEDRSKIDYFRKRLKDNIKDVLATIPRRTTPTNFDRYVEMCIDIDNNLHRRQLETQKKSRATPTTKNNSFNFRNNNTAPVPSSSSTLPPGIPMEIDATKTKPHGPLTDEEKARRKREGLCAYCGQGKHLIENCPNMSDRAKKALAARKASPSGKA